MSRSLKILGIETSSIRCEIALATSDEFVACAQLPLDTKPTAALVPAIRDLCRSAGWSASQLELVCVDQGPGSYTGLRVGITCAKTIAFAAGAQLATAASPDVVAYNAPDDETLVEVAFDAARGEVYSCRFRRDGTVWIRDKDLLTQDAREWVSGLDPAALVTGPALVKYRGLLPASARVADEPIWWPRAAQVIRLGLAQHQVQPLVHYFLLEPLYLRPSSPEAKRIANGKPS